MTSACYIKSSNHQNNGLLTKIWGGSGWFFNHAITFGYPKNPTEQQKKEYRDYFLSLGKVLPCKFCRDSYQNIITTGDTMLTDEVLSNRETLTQWFYRVHEAVNKKIGINYGITYQDLINKYESFRARCESETTGTECTMPSKYKAISFRKFYERDCPIVPLKIVWPFVKLAKIRGLDKSYFIFLKVAIKLNGDFDMLKKQKCWKYRNKICFKIIKYMQKNAIPSIEIEGEWRGTPTIPELKLLMFLSSNLNYNELKNISKKINSEKIKS
ncbi:MAG: Erv1/Alr family FAD-linked sulfhydryl oxidase [Thermoplasmata archaeon]